MELLIDKYIKYLRYERNYSSHTEISYFNDLKQFCTFIQNNHPELTLTDVDANIIRLWIVSLMNEKTSPRSVNRKISALKSFYKYLLRIGTIEIDPTRKASGPKTKKPIPSFVKTSDIEAILNDNQTEDSFETFRNHVIMELFYVTGIRRAELIGLKDTDVDFSLKSIKVTGKRNKQRIIPLSNSTLDLLNQYINRRNEEIENTPEALFVKNDGQPLYPMLVHRIVTNILKWISTLSKKSPHVLRHTFATDMLNNGADINAVKELLGHSSLASTEVYTHTSFEELKKIYNKAHPRAEKKEESI